jgi:hypothetical protein
VVGILLLLLVVVPDGVEAGRHQQKVRKYSNRRHNINKMVCNPEPKSVWLRNDCLDGFVGVISDRRVVSLHNQGIDQHDTLGNNTNCITVGLKNNFKIIIFRIFRIYFRIY